MTSPGDQMESLPKPPIRVSFPPSWLIVSAPPLPKHQIGADAGDDGIGAIGRVAAAQDGLPDRYEAHVDRVGPGAAQELHRANGAVGKEEVVSGAAVEDAGIAGGQNADVVVAGAAAGADETGPRKDEIVAAEADNGAGADIVVPADRIITIHTCNIIRHRNLSVSLI
jgi:hypothetical protein